MLQNQIEPKRFYSLAEIVKYGFLVGVVPSADLRAIRNYLEAKRIRNITQGKGVARRYYVKGEHLTTFIAKVEAGDIL